MKSYVPKKRTGAAALATMLLLSGAGLLQSCEKDELVGQPSWLGNSIYERLQEEGNYNYTLRLIDDLDQTSVLSQTGSKTLFVAEDKVYEDFFKSNTWGVRKYEDLTSAQKKLLFNSAMVNNAYLVELLSNVSGNPPSEGQCMRRETAASVFDSISRIYPAEMPNTEFWAKYKDKKEGIVLLRDNTTKPMIHFLPAYMKLNKITDSDLAVLTNGVSTSAQDAWVNGKKLVERDITCKNGYIQKVEGLPTASDNMAAIVHSHSNMSRFASLLDRFCAPYYDEAATKEYNRLYNNTDSVFTLKYFSSTSNTSQYGASTGGELNTDPDGNLVDAMLSFDPGWNQYMYTNTAGFDLHYDAGAMLAPTNAALDFWWNHDGKVLQDLYGTWENVPMQVLVKLLDINLISSFSETVPSKFNNILDNTTKVALGVKAEDVDSCFMGCNGVVYMLNRVYSPASYSSVSFPALVNEETMNVIYWAIKNLEFEPYLNSMDAYYSFIIPTNTSMLTYLDPCTYGTSNPILYEFYYDFDRKTVKAHRYYYDMVNHCKQEGARQLSDATDTQIANRLTDMLDNLIIVGNIEDGHTYYKTKGGSVVKVENAGREGVMKIYGGLQVEEGLSNVTVQTIYDQTTSGNGKSYIMNDEMPMCSRNSLYKILSAHPEYSKFLDLIRNGGTANKLMAAISSGYSSVGEYNVTLFDAYNYTVYVPTNEEIDRLHNEGLLPDWTDYENLTAEQFNGNATALKQAKAIVANRITNFLRYHIQDNSVFIGGEPVSNMKYETATLNPANKRFFSVLVTADDNSMTITDQLGNVRNVVKNKNLYNLIGREYWVQAVTNVNNNQIYNASDLVVHQIDGALFYDDAQLTPWEDEVKAIPTEAKGRR